jgi:hypothetical protein
MRNLTETDYELLSSYIDGELSDAERMAVETRLNAEDDLRRELASLRQTVALVNQLPKLKAPRNFTLEKPVIESRTIPFPMTAAFSALSAAAAVLLLVFGGYLLTFSGNRLARQSPQAAFEPGQIAQAPTVITDAQDLFENNQTFTPTGERDVTNEVQNQDALESAVGEEAETPVADSLPFTIALPTMTEAVETSTSGQGGAGGDQSAETGFFAMPAETQPPPSADSAAPITMQQAVESTDEERDDEIANSAAGLTLASTPQSAATATPMPPMIAQESASDATIQRASAPTESSPIPPVPPTPIPQQKVEVMFDGGLVGLLSIIMGIVLLIAALATTLARRRRKMA